jgi:hypothetical protein
MSAYLITAVPGSGKSTVIAELARRGYAAYDTDEIPGATEFEDLHGNIISKPTNPIDWNIYGWNWQSAKIHELLESADTVFLGAHVGNQSDFYAEFDHIFVLTVDEDTLRQRILTRTTNDYGKHPDDLQHMLNNRDAKQAGYLALPQAIAIDGTQTVGAVADEILRHVKGAS